MPGYTQYRKLCNVGSAETFDDLASNISPKNIERLKSAYQSVDDIDLFIGMAAEEPENALVGNTYKCLIADQFARLKKGDRYFYDLKEQDGSFSKGKFIPTEKSNCNVNLIKPNTAVFSYLRDNFPFKCFRTTIRNSQVFHVSFDMR